MDVTPDETPADGISVDDLSDVPRARHYVADRLGSESGSDLRDLAELVATELVTNALLHGRRPISLHIRNSPGLARIEVTDASPVLPEIGYGGEEEMTGRGLALIEATASRWGADPVAGGKTVWCELVEEVDDPSDAAGSIPSPSPSSSPAAPPPPAPSPSPSEPGPPAGTEASRPGPMEAVPVPRSPEPLPVAAVGAPGPLIRLPDVPVALLLATEGHVDDLIRDLTLAGSNRSREDAVPATVAGRVAAAAETVAPIRRSLKRQALEAHHRGAETTELLLPHGPDVVAATSEYLAALDEADSYCRAARLLTLETPPQHRALRTWMADQVARATRQDLDEPGRQSPVEPFRDRLLAELATLAVAQRTAARSGRLHRVATGLSEARTPEQVAGVVLEEGVAALGAARGALLRTDGGQLSLAGTLGMGDAALLRAATLSLDDQLPTVEALRTGEVVWVESLAERNRRYPELEQADPASRALVAAPLMIGDRTLGALRFGFDTDLVVDDDERGFVRALAAQAASALDRSLSYAAEHEARRAAEHAARRLGRLQTITAALSATLEEAEVASAVLGQAVAALGCRIGTMCLLDRPGPLRTLPPDSTIRIAHEVGLTETARSRWMRFSLADPLPVGDAIRSGSPIVLPTVAERRERYPSMAQGLPVAEHALVVVPLAVGERRLGALTFSFFAEDETFDDADLGFLNSVADVCAQALDRAEAVRSLRTASARLAFLAEASVELSSSLDYESTLRRVADLAIPVLADWCTVATVEADGLRTLAVAHVDERRVSVAQELERRWPPDPETSTVHRVLRTGRAEIYPHVTDEQILALARDDEHRRLLEQIGPMRSGMLVPMTARGHVLGVLTLVSSSDDRRFGPDDLSLAEDLGRRAALAIDNAALFRDRGDVGSRDRADMSDRGDGHQP